MKKLLLFLFCLLTLSSFGAVYQNSFVTDPIGNPLLITTPELANFLSNPFQKTANANGFSVTNAASFVANGAGIGFLILSDTNSGGFAEFFNTGSNLLVTVAATNSSGTLQTNVYIYDGAGNQTNVGKFDSISGQLVLGGSTVSRSDIFLNNSALSWNIEGGLTRFFISDATHAVTVASWSDTLLTLSGGLTLGGAGIVDLAGNSISDGSAAFTFGTSQTWTATNGFSSDQTHWTIMPTNNGTANQVITVSGVSGNTNYTKYAAAAGGGGSSWLTYYDNITVYAGGQGVNSTRYNPMLGGIAVNQNDNGSAGSELMYFQDGGVISNICIAFQTGTFTVPSTTNTFFGIYTNGFVASSPPTTVVLSPLSLTFLGGVNFQTNSGTAAVTIGSNTWACIGWTNNAVIPVATKTYALSWQFLPN